MRFLFAVTAVMGLVAAPALGRAEEESSGGAQPAEAAAPATGASAKASEPRFDIRRGLHSEGDFGVFLTFGGTNTNNPALPSRATSNIQPYVGVMVGYDVLQGDNWNLALGGKFALLLNGGAGRVSNAEIADTSPGAPDPTTKSNDFAVYETGLAVHFGYLLTDRLALNVKADGGLAVLDPDPSLAAANYDGDPLDQAGGIGVGGIFGVGLGVEWFTLLNGFSVGATARYVGILADGLISGVSVTFPVKYNF
jgi:hypothetical protein